MSVMKQDPVRGHKRERLWLAEKRSAEMGGLPATTSSLQGSNVRGPKYPACTSRKSPETCPLLCLKAAGFRVQIDGSDRCREPRI